MSSTRDIEGLNKWSDGFKACPDCGSTKFYEGPHGGMSVNIKCAGCGHRFNVMGPFGVERISHFVEPNGMMIVTDERPEDFWPKIRHALKRSA